MSLSVSPKKQTKQKLENQTEKAKSLVWDCGSSLYDSFELKSFERQLHSAISSRTLSMPHLSNPRAQQPPLPLPPPPPPQPTSKKSSKLSRSFQKLVRSIFGPKQTSSSSLFKMQQGTDNGFYLLYDRYGALSTIPEVPETGVEHGSHSAEVKSMVGRSASARCSATCISITESIYPKRPRLSDSVLLD